MKLIDILNEVRPEVDFSTSDNYIEDELLDSFDVATVVGRLAEEYGITITGEDIVSDNFSSLSSLQALVKKYGITGEI